MKKYLLTEEVYEQRPFFYGIESFGASDVHEQMHTHVRSLSLKEKIPLIINAAVRKDDVSYNWRRGVRWKLREGGSRCSG